MSELLPCPFCGGEASVIGDSESGYAAFCHECINDGHTEVGWYFTKADAVDAWNTRTLGGEECVRVKRGTKPDGTPRYRCSVCGYGLGDYRWAYCPKCGSKIRKEVER